MRSTWCLWLILAVHPACDSQGSETDTDTDTDTDLDTDTDSDVHQPMTPVAPVFDVTLNSGQWLGDPGYYLGGGTSYLRGDQKAGEIQFQVEIAGDLRQVGNHDVRSVKFTDAVPTDATWDFVYQAHPAEATFEVIGHSEDVEHIWGHLVGEIPLQLTDGTGVDLTVEALEVVSWPKF